MKVKLDRCQAMQYLVLNPKAPVFLLVNLDDNLANGSLGTVLHCGKYSVTIKFTFINSPVSIQPYVFTVYDSTLAKVVATRKELPVKLSYALTAHKAQGVTLDHILYCRCQDN